MRKFQSRNSCTLGALGVVRWDSPGSFVATEEGQAGPGWTINLIPFPSIECSFIRLELGFGVIFTWYGSSTMIPDQGTMTQLATLRWF